MGATNDLLLIVRINESIKSVVRLARKINILALNAILLSRRAGSVALGYTVISNELRLFSRELTLVMNKLTAVSNDAVQVVSYQCRYNHINELMNATSLGIELPVIQHQLLASDAKLGQMSRELQERYGHLKSVLIDADDNSRFGTVISRSLKIEATYCGAFAPHLTQIASEFGEYIDGIPPLLNEAKLYMQKKL